MPSLNAAAIEEDIYFMAVLQDLWEYRFDRGVVGQVCNVDCGFPAELLDELLGFLIGCIALGRTSALQTTQWKGDVHLTCTRRTSAPDSANASVMDWPMPRVPPVTNAVCPSRENSFCMEFMADDGV